MNDVIHKNEYMSGLFRYIENNLYNNFDIKNLLNISNYSLMQLYRNFYSLTGHSINEYIRKRRLSNALALVKHSSMSFIDIAYMCGYSSHQNFSKAVKQNIDLSPTEYQKSDIYFYFPHYNTKYAKQILVKSENIPETTCISFYHSRLTGIENKALAYLFTLIPDFNGKIYGQQGKQKGSKFCYELRITEAERYQQVLLNSNFCDIHTLPAYSHLFAMMTTQNDESKINDSWNYLYNHWLKSSMFATSDISYFEEYCKHHNKIDKLKLYLPIEKSNDLLNINIKTFNKKTFICAKQHGIFADEVASDILLNLISEYPAFLQKDAYQILVLRSEDSYICAIPADKGLVCNTMESFTMPAGAYAVLECECCDDYSIYETILTSFLSENRFECEGLPIFAIYEADSDFENIKLKLYCKLKNVNTGKAIF